MLHYKAKAIMYHCQIRLHVILLICCSITISESTYIHIYLKIEQFKRILYYCSEWMLFQSPRQNDHLAAFMDLRMLANGTVHLIIIIIIIDSLQNGRSRRELRLLRF